ncbi:hypothetical protein BDP27DRAFT_1336906 [Rhodocollybia butyracea]|uniref:Uncharacterized protein n=1 Tax=Rhodocollybia butyracea TaxID=206335 RepID=A0A9P5PHJ8_9AGAR|nr:hypothetical protein BDP27DRAFT_1336906 [Rhodocollybia butyracea]
MQLTTLLIWLPLLVSVSIVYCEVQIDVIAVDTNGNHIGNKETEPPSWISDSVHKVILSALELDGGSTKPIYLGFGPTAKEHVVYLQVMVKNEDSTIWGVKCFGFISTNGHVGLFRLLKEPKEYPIGFTSKMQCPMETIAYEEKVEKEVSMESAKEWYSIARRSFKDANQHTTASQKAEALSRMPEMDERFFGHHAVMAKKQMEGGERKEKDKGREKEWR